MIREERITDEIYGCAIMTVAKNYWLKYKFRRVVSVNFLEINDSQIDGNIYLNGKLQQNTDTQTIFPILLAVDDYLVVLNWDNDRQ